MRRRGLLAAAAIVLFACGCTVPGQSPFAPVDDTPPTVRFTLPAEKAKAVPTGATVSIYFSEAMNWDTVDLGAMRLVAGPETATGHLDRTGETFENLVRFVPDKPLTAGVAWTMTVKGTVEDRYYNAMGKAFVLHFTTAQSPAPFTVTSVTPADGSTGMDPGVVVAVTMSAPVPVQLVTPQAFFLTGSTGLKVNSAVGPVMGSGGKSVEISPRAPLSKSTTYTVHVAKGLESVDASILASEFTSTFTTGP